MSNLNRFNQSKIEEYAVIDSLDRRLRKLNFTGDSVLKIMAHVRGLNRLDKIKTYKADIGSYQSLVDLGMLKQPGQIFSYDTEDGELFIVGMGQIWKKLKIWKNSKYYCLEIVE